VIHFALDVIDPQDILHLQTNQAFKSIVLTIVLLFLVNKRQIHERTQLDEWFAKKTQK
jgi:hypothetical protein